ncbi:MAG: hypothetical protein R2809_10160 [Flavobacteriales bacterium]
MDINSDKIELIDWIIRQEDALPIKRMKVLIAEMESDNQDINKIVGQTIKGVRVTKQMLVLKIMQSLKKKTLKTTFRLI